MEIERKWLVDKELCPIKLDDKFIRQSRIVQGYLNDMSDSHLIRYRSYESLSKTKSFILEIKSKGMLSREEYGYNITEEDFNEVIDKCKTVKKIRYHYISLNVPDCVFEIDVYDDYPFVTCEVEFKSEKAAESFIAPPWCFEEVTYNKLFKNINLAK